jgi:hypothetical protein
MMFLILGYIALVVYAAGLFTWSVMHGREGAAVGILLCISGLQLTVMETINTDIGVGIAVFGLLVVGRDIVLALRRGERLAPAFVRVGSERGKDVA